MRAFVRELDDAAARKAALDAVRSDAAKDNTSRRCIPATMQASGRIVAKSDFTLCGVAEADAIFKSRGVRVNWRKHEGEFAKKGDDVCTVEGNARAILACERTVLNYLSLLSGIATKCRAASQKYGKWKISATRKTLPNLTHSQKRAVAIGGCLTHRLTLADGILVKDNHLAAIMEGEGAAREEAIAIAVGRFPRGAFVEVEVSSVNEALAAMRAGAKAILIDNLPEAKFAKVAKAARGENGRVVIEASGGIALANAGKYLEAGADFVSTSELTMKVAPANLSLEFDF